MIVRATRILYNGKASEQGNMEIRLTIGKPNYAEREFIKDCKKAGEPFPVERVQLMHVPVKRPLSKRSKR